MFFNRRPSQFHVISRNRIQFTEENDNLKVTYDRDARILVSALTKTEALLNDRSIDNTLQGARARLDRFKDYKVITKRSILAAHFNLEALHSNIATRLSESEHPPFVPSAPELKIDALAARIRNLQVLEQVEAHLNAEVSRQFQLLQLERQSQLAIDKIVQWAKSHIATVLAVPSISSSADARVRLKYLEAAEKVGAFGIFVLIFH